jgi:beta-glucosidase
MHGNQSLLTDVLKGRMGFDGFVVGDWNGHGQVAGCTPQTAPGRQCGPGHVHGPRQLEGPVRQHRRPGEVGPDPMARVDDAVRRILRVKAKLGLFQTARPLEGSRRCDG